MLELSIQGKTRNGRKDDIAEDIFEIAPSIIYNRRTPFVISVKNNRKLDYENLKNIEFEVSMKFFFVLLINTNKTLKWVALT